MRSVFKSDRVWRSAILVGASLGGIVLTIHASDGPHIRDDPSSLERGAAKAVSANGAGIMVAGELWDSFLPPNAGAYYGEVTQPINAHILRIGNFDRVWSTPTHVWPGGWTNGNFWGKDMYLVEFNPDTTWNPPVIGTAANPAYRASSGSQYAFASYKSTVAGATDVNRNYKRETRWVDDQKRQQALYEAGWPTNIGLDVQVRIRQFSLNWNNFNDFITVEVTLKNTGNVDINADGVIERTGNRINAMTLSVNGEFMSSYALGRSGGRAANRFGATRAIGYVGDADPKGNPWDIMVGFAGESATGVKDMGLNDFPFRFYTDVWSGWSWLAVKRGASSADSLHRLPDKQTLFGTHPIGVGVERGWYTSGGQGRGINIREFRFDDPKSFHTAAMGTWYQDGGKMRDATTLNRLPNSAFFSGGVTGNPLTFVPKANPSRPNGDRKLYSLENTSAFEVNPYETGWTKGFTGADNFDGDMFSGVGPFSLDVGETITIVWAEAGGYRLAGIQNAISAARWAFENGNAVPTVPNLPAIRIDNTFSKTTRIRWDDKAETHPRFAGYKVYKANAAKQIDWLSGGMKGLNEYWKNRTPGETPALHLEAVNPAFTAFDFVESNRGVADSWGPYELVAVIPADNLVSIRDVSANGFQYSWEDKTVDLGFKYWYYVAAYTNETVPVDLGPSYSGLLSRTSSTLETPNTNRNGASGLWEGTYPFADLSSFYPKTAEGQRAIGAGFTVKSARANPSGLTSGETKISVKPNPYKKKALFDSAIDSFDHKVTFYNLPARAKITVLDVAGQVIKEINFESNDPNSGSVFWDLFSKDGVEVASGLYIYVVEFDGGQHVGHLSILR